MDREACMKCCGMRQMDKLETMNFDLSLITG
jgi:hypothetical protein